MKTLTLTLELPEFVDVEPHELKMMIASKLFEAGKLSAGQAAQLVGISKAAFMSLVGQYGVSIFNHSPDDLEKDLLNADPQKKPNNLEKFFGVLSDEVADQMLKDIYESRVSKDWDIQL